ncbi:hypothetical protein SADUNF_Sadunf15G0075300 [Salix dunnii]|uniref:Uncharacterized protein n=1 Tax=Salix dunnii TaxID=1413687 RepID=A0A835MJA8_9ROSI|nr:hypothetical protein SADUNF_Sadunf15G0075300 [Salix dunnii]
MIVLYIIGSNRDDSVDNLMVEDFVGRAVLTRSVLGANSGALSSGVYKGGYTGAWIGTVRIGGIQLETRGLRIVDLGSLVGSHERSMVSANYKYQQVLVRQMRKMKYSCGFTPWRLPHRSLRALFTKYGPLMLLHFGKAPTMIVLSIEVKPQRHMKRDEAETWKECELEESICQWEERQRRTLA